MFYRPSGWKTEKPILSHTFDTVPVTALNAAGIRQALMMKMMVLMMAVTTTTTIEISLSLCWDSDDECLRWRTTSRRCTTASRKLRWTGSGSCGGICLSTSFLVTHCIHKFQHRVYMYYAAVLSALRVLSRLSVAYGLLTRKQNHRKVHRRWRRGSSRGG